MSEQRQRILEALARGDGQMMDGFDMGHTAETMYGKQADSVDLLIAKEIRRFARTYALDLIEDARLAKGLPGDRVTRKVLRCIAKDLSLAATAEVRRAQARYNETPLAKPLRLLAEGDQQ